jgi:hypothetical protein
LFNRLLDTEAIKIAAPKQKHTKRVTFFGCFFEPLESFGIIFLGPSAVEIAFAQLSTAGRMS